MVIQPQIQLVRTRIKYGVLTLFSEMRKSAKRPQRLYHYTDAHGFKGIIESGAIRASHLGFMNDAAEYKTGSSKLRHQLLSSMEKAKGPTTKSLLSELEKQLDNNYATTAPDVFISCFCGYGNKLNQWRSYGKSECIYSLGFRISEMDAIAKSRKWILSPVVYDYGKQLFYMDQLIEKFILAVRPTALKLSGTIKEKYIAESVAVLLDLATPLISVMKHSSFSEEEEWRLICLPEDPQEIEYLPGSSMLKPYVNLTLSKNDDASLSPLSLIWIGPGRHQEINLQSTLSFLEKNLLPEVETKCSQIPYRQS